MIYTVTLNPAIDRITHFPGLVFGGLNRATASRADLGGKGVIRLQGGVA
jgi:fructose-1-phosphate kinase PfkB-like protein